jgi:hypothetical protein
MFRHELFVDVCYLVAVSSFGVRVSVRAGLLLGLGLKAAKVGSSWLGLGLEFRVKLRHPHG